MYEDLNFFQFWKYGLKKIKVINYPEQVSIIRKIFDYDTGSCYKNISKIRNIKFIFENFAIFFKNVHKIEIIHINSEKSINPFFHIKKSVG